MIRAATLSASVLVLASSAVLAVPGVATAETPTCQGEPATLVGPNNGQSTEGTDGDDVIVTTADAAAGPGWIRAGAGNDVLCIVPGNGLIPNPRADQTFTVTMGDGNDSVTVEEERNVSHLSVELGDGDDAFAGSSRAEYVWGGNVDTAFPYLGGDSGRDHIDAGLGADTIHSGSPSPDIRNDDVVISGPGGDSLYIGGTGAVLDNGGTAGDGTGDNLGIIHPGWLQRRVTVDNTARTATSDSGVFLQWSNVKHFHVLVDSPLTFTGSAAAERLAVSTELPVEYRYGTTVDATMGAGDDEFTFSSGPLSGTVDGGEGTDALELPRCSTVAYRVGKVLDCGATGADDLRYPFRINVSSWEGPNRVLAGHRADVIGTSHADDIMVRAPRVRLAGRGGDDHLTISSWARTTWSVVLGGNGADIITGGKRADRLSGGRGHDKLWGMAGPDLLVGGRGPDVARGGTGRDRCFAETSTRCEAPRT